MNPTITVCLYRIAPENKWEARINTAKEFRIIEGRFDTELDALHGVIKVLEYQNGKVKP